MTPQTVVEAFWVHGPKLAALVLLLAIVVYLVTVTSHRRD